jgi:hypothetical protein
MYRSDPYGLFVKILSIFGELSVAVVWSISHYFANVGLPTTSSVFRKFKCLLVDCQLQSQDDDARYSIEEK